MKPEVSFTVSQFIEVCNQSLEYAFSDVVVEGEVASFKINQGKWVFFDLKEADSCVSCFMVVSQLHAALTDGMKVRVRATPKLTRWGKFSLTIKQVMPVGEGSIKKNFELLKKKLIAEGLFDSAKKRPLPPQITKIGVISSTAAAGYHDFLKILDNRWGGLSIQTINTQVQGLAAPEQIVRALDYFNQRGTVDVIAILRGGGSADDLSAFNDEQLARAIAASRIPVITGIGHEVDESLADLAADIRASTPSNAAERLSPDRTASQRHLYLQIDAIRRCLFDHIAVLSRENRQKLVDARAEFLRRIDSSMQHVVETQKILLSLSPEGVLSRGYAILVGKLSPGSTIQIITKKQELTAEITHAKKR